MGGLRSATAEGKGILNTKMEEARREGRVLFITTVLWESLERTSWRLPELVLLIKLSSTLCAFWGST